LLYDAHKAADDGDWQGALRLYERCVAECGRLEYRTQAHLFLADNVFSTSIDAGPMRRHLDEAIKGLDELIEGDPLQEQWRHGAI
jgi:hypothetical protein